MFFKESIGIRASIGIGKSKLGARIATRLAKENQEGQREMTEPELKIYVRTLPVTKLPGVGYATSEKLGEVYRIDTCEQLEKISLEELKKTFGEKTGEKLYWYDLRIIVFGKYLTNYWYFGIDCDWKS